MALDVVLTCLPGIPAGAGPVVKGGGKVFKLLNKGEKIVEGVDKTLEGVKASKNTLELLKDAKLVKGHLKVEKDILNEIGRAESKGLDFSTLSKEVTERSVLGRDGSRSYIIKYSDSQGTKYVVHEVYDSEGMLIHRDFDSVRIESGQYVDDINK